MGDYIGDYYGGIKGDTRSLDYSSYGSLFRIRGPKMETQYSNILLVGIPKKESECLETSK